MTRHISDRDHGATGSARLVQYARIERGAGQSAPAKDLHKRRQDDEGDGRIRAFVQIERRAARQVSRS